MDLKQIQQQVEDVLRMDPKARDNDDYLYALVCRAQMREKVDTTRISLDAAFKNSIALGLPNYESIRRTRQKAQRDNPELKGTIQNRRRRAALEREYREYARG